MSRPIQPSIALLPLAVRRVESAIPDRTAAADTGVGSEHIASEASNSNAMDPRTASMKFLLRVFLFNWKREDMIESMIGSFGGTVNSVNLLETQQH